MVLPCSPIGPAATQILPVRPAATQIIPADIRVLFFIVPRIEKREKLLSFVASKVPVMEISIPGDTRKYVKSSDPARHTTTAIVHWLCDLHNHGWTLDGQFDASDFGITRLGALKGEIHLMNKLKKLGGRMRWKDMEAGANMIEHAVYFDGLLVGLPVDTENLISLMRNFKRKKYFLIKFHICHDNEAMKYSVFVVMYNRLMVIQALDNVKYRRIINKIQCGMKNRIDRSKKNLNHGQAHFVKDDSVDIWSRQVGLVAAIAASEKLAASKKLVAAGTAGAQPPPPQQAVVADQAEHMYSVIVPKMLCQFQKAMHMEGELHNLGWYEESLVRLIRK